MLVFCVLLPMLFLLSGITRHSAPEDPCAPFARCLGSKTLSVYMLYIHIMDGCVNGCNAAVVSRHRCRLLSLGAEQGVRDSIAGYNSLSRAYSQR